MQAEEVADDVRDRLVQAAVRSKDHSLLNTEGAGSVLRKLLEGLPDEEASALLAQGPAAFGTPESPFSKESARQQKSPAIYVTSLSGRVSDWRKLVEVVSAASPLQPSVQVR